MKTPVPPKISPQGFSLVELLVVIVVIAIIAAIVIPNIANVIAQTNSAKDRRNAQTIASVAAAAKAAGATNDLHLKSTIIGHLEESGVQVSGMKFGMSPLTPEERTGALGYLEDGDDTNSTVLYSFTPVAAAIPAPTP